MFLCPWLGSEAGFSSLTQNLVRISLALGLSLPRNNQHAPLALLVVQPLAHSRIRPRDRLHHAALLDLPVLELAEARDAATGVVLPQADHDVAHGHLLGVEVAGVAGVAGVALVVGSLDQDRVGLAGADGHADQVDVPAAVADLAVS